MSNPPENSCIVCSSEELEKLIEKAVKKAFTDVGVKHNDSNDIFEARADFRFLRDLRLLSEAVRNKGIMTVVALLITAMAGAVWIGIAAIFSKGN